MAFWCEKKYDLSVKGGKNKHFLWFPSITTIFLEKPHPSARINGDKVILRAKGEFKSKQGIRADVSKKQTALPTAPVSSNKRRRTGELGSSIVTPLNEEEEVIDVVTNAHVIPHAPSGR